MTKLPDGGNRIQCIELSCQRPLLLVSVCMHCKGLKGNVEKIADCLAQLYEIFKKYATTHWLLLCGDFNVDLSIQKTPGENVFFHTRLGFP